MFGAIAAGAATWTLLEYVLHRWLGHDRRLRRNPFGIEHLRHHAQGNYFAAASKKLAIAAIVTVVLGVPVVGVAGLSTGVAYLTGLMGFYAAYEWLHLRNHTHPGRGPYGRWARRHHFHHHFVDPRVNHGVTTPLWDVVFRTYRRPKRIKVPARLSMAWLLDPVTGDVRTEHADSYELARPGRELRGES
jgi:sterol desaturase/sphingolipid hydroxylase (fatty acid hydroxylase superfamily)